MRTQQDPVLKQIVDFVGEYARNNSGYSPQVLASGLIRQFRVKPEDAAKLALLVEEKVINSQPDLAALELNLTFNCNLTCEYCFVHNKNPQDRMSLATAQKAIDVLFERPYPTVSITLFGGEPLLEFALIRQIVPYALEKAQAQGIKVEWALTTNGTLINEEILQFFARHQINMLLSLDGGPETHDRYRRTKSGEGTWQTIAGLIPLFKAYQPWLGARMTVSPAAAITMREDFFELVKLGINQFIIGPAQGSKCWSREQVQQYGDNLLQIQQDYFALKQRGAAIFIEDFEQDGSNGQQDKGWGCRAGFTSLAVAPNGDVSPCSKLLGLTDIKGKYIVGNVHSGIDEQQLGSFREAGSQPPMTCQQCSQPCTGGCYAVNYEQTGNHFTPSEENCLFWAIRQKIKYGAKDR